MAILENHPGHAASPTNRLDPTILQS